MGYLSEYHVEFKLLEILFINNLSMIILTFRREYAQCETFGNGWPEEILWDLSLGWISEW